MNDICILHSLDPSTRRIILVRVNRKVSWRTGTLTLPVSITIELSRLSEAMLAILTPVFRPHVKFPVQVTVFLFIRKMWYFVFHFRLSFRL